mmetsp:Transcript_8338/g.25146  ORF Transcript_8338/g.25146 Transcript_8338/m.25146 type:complete len:411 (+) Transcript_8338:1065-2297(+)
MYPQYLPPSLRVRERYLDLDLEPSRSQQSVVEQFPPIGHPDQQDVGDRIHPVQFGEYLIDGRAPRRLSRIFRRRSFAKYRVDLVDDHDVKGRTGRITGDRGEFRFGVGEEGTDELLGSADPAIEELGGGDYLGGTRAESAGDFSGEGGLSASRRTVQQQPLHGSQPQQRQLLRLGRREGQLRRGGISPPGGGGVLPLGVDDVGGTNDAPVQHPTHDRLDLRTESSHGRAKVGREGVVPVLAREGHGGVGSAHRRIVPFGAVAVSLSVLGEEVEHPARTPRDPSQRHIVPSSSAALLKDGGHLLPQRQERHLQYRARPHIHRLVLPRGSAVLYPALDAAPDGRQRLRPFARPPRRTRRSARRKETVPGDSAVQQLPVHDGGGGVREGRRQFRPRRQEYESTSQPLQQIRSH